MVKNSPAEKLRLEIKAPPLFRCPISLEVMRSPVSLCTGVTYDRSSIQRWLDSGNATCPATMVPLSTTDLIPNLTLRRLINIWASTPSPNSSSRSSRPNYDHRLILSLPNSGADRALYSAPVRVLHPATGRPLSFSTFFSFSISNLNPSSIGGGLAFLLSSSDSSLGDPDPFLGLLNASDPRKSKVLSLSVDVADELVVAAFARRRRRDRQVTGPQASSFLFYFSLSRSNKDLLIPILKSPDFVSSVSPEIDTESSHRRCSQGRRAPERGLTRL